MATTAPTPTDTFFGPPFVDVDEWREAPHRHRFVHGGFEGTHTLFSIYLPEPEAYGGRFIQWLQGGVGGSERSAPLGGALEVARAARAVLVDSNQGHLGNSMDGLRGDPTILQFRASAQVARYAREVAAQMYGSPPHHGYLVGGSGGAMRTTICLEKVDGLWDGGVAFMINHGGMVAFQWPLLVRAQMVLRDRLPEVVDAVDAGGSGDPFGALRTDAERTALADLYLAGYPRGAEHLIVENGIWVLGMLGVRGADPGYFTDFWTKPGYAGYDDPSSLEPFLVSRVARVERVLRSRDFGPPDAAGEDRPVPGVHAALPAEFPMAVLTDLPPGTPGLVGCTMTLADGRRMACTGMVGGALTALLDPIGFDGVEPGDEINLDNRDYVAYAHLSRHLADPDHPETMRHFVDGRPIYPIRHRHLDTLAQMSGGRFHGKLVLVQHTHDRECWPSSGEFFVNRARVAHGSLDERFRVWWIERAAHLPPITRAGTTRLIAYQGAYEAALHHLIAWVEDGTPAPKSTSYLFDGHGRLELPTVAEERQGIQALVSLEAKVEGPTVELTCAAQAPPGAGRIAWIDWDVDGSGNWPYRTALDGDGRTVSVIQRHTYEQPGTFLATARVASVRRAGETAFPVYNLARARIEIS